MGVRYLYLIRHAEPEGDGIPRYLGQADPPLSQRGRIAARRLGAYLRILDPGTVCCSPLRRCVETARFLAPAPIPVSGLEEVCLGAWEGLARDEVRARFPDLYAARGRDLARCAPPGGESFAQAAERAQAALADILSRYGGNVAVVAHAGINRALLCAALGKPLAELMEIPQRYCGVSTLRVGPEGLAAESIDEILWSPGARTGAPGAEREDAGWKSC